jgi:hypothetical protein
MSGPSCLERSCVHRELYWIEKKCKARKGYSIVGKPCFGQCNAFPKLIYIRFEKWCLFSIKGSQATDAAAEFALATKRRRTWPRHRALCRFPRALGISTASCGAAPHSLVWATHGDITVRSVGCKISMSSKKDFRVCVNGNFCEPKRNCSPFMKQQLKLLCGQVPFGHSRSRAGSK